MTLNGHQGRKSVPFQNPREKGLKNHPCPTSITIYIYMTSQLVFSSLIILGNTFLSNRNSEVAASYMLLLSNNEYQCSVCEHRSKFKNNMIKHIDSKHIHHGPESCPFCQKQCSSKQALQKHISRYHRDLND